MTTTRPRTSGLNLQRRQSLRAFYEPFSPNVEEKEEDGAHILRLQLLEFEGQQVKVTVEEAGRTIRVTGERPMGNSRWIRLDKTYSIPEDCIIDKINHQFDQGILTISMPKPTPPQAAADPPLEKDEVRPIETKEPEKDLPKVDSNAENKSAILEKQASHKVKEELERKSTPEREDEKLIQKEEIKNQISEKEKEKEESKTEKEEIKKQISKKEQEELKTAKEEIKNKISENEKEREETKSEKEEIKKQISEKKKEKEESKTEKERKEKEKPETTPIPASRVTRAAKLTGKFAIWRLPWPVKANLVATVVVVTAYYAYTYYRLPTN